MNVLVKGNKPKRKQCAATSLQKTKHLVVFEFYFHKSLAPFYHLERPKHKEITAESARTLSPPHLNHYNVQNWPLQSKKKIQDQFYIHLCKDTKVVLEDQDCNAS